MTKTAIGVAVGLAIGGLVGFGIASSKTDSGSTTQTTMIHSVTDPGLKDLTGEEFDKEFILQMIKDHEGAIEMAELAKTRAQHQEIRALSDEIIGAQTREIEQMKVWQKSWGN